jgi:hypothetical protein
MLAFWPGLAAAGGKKAENLVANGGFEQTLKGWTINARTGQATFELDTRTKKKGKRSLRVSKTGAFSHGDGCFHDFELPPRARSGRIQVRVQVKARKLRNAWFRFQLLDPTGRYLLEEPDLHHPALNGTFAWKRLAKTYEIPPGAVRGRLILDIYFGETIWLDTSPRRRASAARPRPSRSPTAASTGPPVAGPSCAPPPTRWPSTPTPGSRRRARGRSVWNGTSRACCRRKGCTPT